MESWLYKEGEAKGFEKGFDIGLQMGLQRGLARTSEGLLRVLFVRRVGREPTAGEEQALVRRAYDVSAEQLVDVFEMRADALLAWLAA